MGWFDGLARWFRTQRRRWQRGLPLTPFEFRRSLRVLRELYDDDDRTGPYRYLLWLLLRIPWSLPCSLPPTPREIMAYEEKAYMFQHHSDLLDMQMINLWRWRDTPQRSFFRLYEAFCARHEEFIGYETEYSWKHANPAWTVELLRDPRDYGCVDQEQLAVFASLAEALTESFNWRLMWGWLRDGLHVEKEGDEGPPVYVSVLRPHPWAAEVPRLEERLVLHDYGRWKKYYDIGDDDGFTGEVCPFEKRNREAGDGSLRTI